MLQKRLLILSFIAILLLPLASGCAPASAQGAADFSDRKIRTIATTGMVADIARHVGGDRLEVTALMGPGVDPHLFKPSERDVISLADADLIMYNGLHLEAQMARVFEKMGGRVHTIAVASGIDPSLLLAPAAFKGNYDPHVWFDVSMWMQAVEAARDGLIEMDPTHADEYRANTEAYLAELKNLDDYVRAQAGRVPAERRVLITAHDAFNYFGRAYGFEVRGLQGISTATEAGTGDVQDLANFIVERRIPAIFVESSVPRRTVEAVQAAARARGFDVQIGGQLYSDAPGTAGTPDGTYTGMVKHNIDTIVTALLRNPD